MKHNNQLPNGHFHKDWQRYIKTWYDQPGRKKSRRVARAKKALKVAPRPVDGLLRPIAHCQTLKYNMKGAGINPKMARSIGIAVDHRRTNRSEESLQANIQRLKSYKARLVLLPKKKKSSKYNKKTVEPVSLPKDIVTKGPTIPILPIKDPETMRVMDGEKGKGAYATLREARGNVKVVGIRVKAAEKKKSGF